MEEKRLLDTLRERFDDRADRELLRRSGCMWLVAHHRDSKERITNGFDLFEYEKPFFRKRTHDRAGVVDGAAELLEIEDTTGAVEPGLEADLIVVEKNPLEDGQTLTAAMASLGAGTDSVAGSGLAFQSLYFLGALLFLLTLVLNLLSDIVVRRFRQVY